MPSGRGHPDSFAILTCSWMTSATYADRMSPRFTAHRVTASYPASVSQKSHSRHRLFPPPLVPDGSGRRIILSASSRLPAYRSSTFCGISIHRSIRAIWYPCASLSFFRCSYCSLPIIALTRCGNALPFLISQHPFRICGRTRPPFDCSSRMTFGRRLFLFLEEASSDIPTGIACAPSPSTWSSQSCFGWTNGARRLHVSGHLPKSNATPRSLSATSRASNFFPLFDVNPLTRTA